MKDIVLLGDRNPQFVTHRELDAALQLFPRGVTGRWVPTDSVEAGQIGDADGVWAVSGTPYRNDENAYAAISHARTCRQPFLGTCGGFQYAVVEFARNEARIEGAAHEETAPTAGVRVVRRLSCSLVGEERQVTAIPGTRLYDLCGPAPFTGFHWCNYGMASEYVNRLGACGLQIAATAEDAGVEAVELRDHPFFLATLFQPQ
ncbi:MAG TPA: hypothetical protein VFZ98_13660, partial [Vicinamibacterales bacterium]